MDKTLEYYSIQRDSHNNKITDSFYFYHFRFCKLLCTKTSRDNPLYISCLNTLGKMLKTMQVMRSVKRTAKGTVLIQGLSLFVSELGYEVIKGLDSCINSQQIAVMSLSGDLGLLPICLADLLPCYIVELGILHGVFLKMLGKLDECLKTMEISIGKIALNTLILNSRRNDDHRWILEHKDLTSFESRMHLTMMVLPELKYEDGDLFEMLIDREQLLAESFEYISTADVKHLLGGRLFMEFKSEEATGPDVLREWFCSVCQAICNPQNALFLVCPDDNRRFFPNPASDVNPLHLRYFHFCGRVTALSLVYKVQVGILFDRTFFLLLAGKTVSLEDVRDADPLFYSSCKKILEMDIDLLDSDAWGLTFVREVEKLGCRKIEELHPGGNSIPLNSKNREAYVNLLIQHRFSEILCDTSLLEFFFQSLEHEDLDRMLHGSDRAICVEDWKAHTEYNGCKKTDSQIIWFWKISKLIFFTKAIKPCCSVEGMSDEQRRVLLFFWTSVKYLPVEGFGGLQSRLHIYKSHNSHERLPSAHTCFYRLCLPRHKSKAIMQKSLQIITREHLSCSFGMG
ncbi:hypothetical protein MKX01_007298 [Papaver californicum]|nr:hypothetical protein MKX01_007298 [Papaver californicum]